MNLTAEPFLLECMCACASAIFNLYFSISKLSLYILAEDSPDKGASCQTYGPELDSWDPSGGSGKPAQTVCPLTPMCIVSTYNIHTYM